jgi:hypothetical protein
VAQIGRTGSRRELDVDGPERAVPAAQTSETGAESSPRGGLGRSDVVEEGAVGRGSAVVDPDPACSASNHRPGQRPARRRQEAGGVEKCYCSARTPWTRDDPGEGESEDTAVGGLGGSAKLPRGRRRGSRRHEQHVATAMYSSQGLDVPWKEKGEA